jgi:hypothetical protein
MLSALPSDVLVDVLAGLLVGGFGAFFVWFGRQLKGVSAMTRDWNGEPARPGISNGKPGVMQRLYTQDEQFTAVLERLGKQDVVLADIRHEVFPNSGKSLKDITNKTHNDLTEHIKRSEEWRESVEARLENPDAS